MSNRLSDGQRVNQWGKNGSPRGMGNKRADGTIDDCSRPSHITLTKASSSRRRNGSGKSERFGHDENGAVKGSHKREIPARKVITRIREGMHNQDQSYSMPLLANPGNVIKPTYTLDEVRQLLAACGIRDDRVPDTLRHIVGGGVMGDKLAHLNEAPFPEKLAEFFIRSFCPPGGIVCDPFVGSGTTPAVALRHGRRSISCDIRRSQIDLTIKRLGNVLAEKS